MRAPMRSKPSWVMANPSNGSSIDASRPSATTMTSLPKLRARARPISSAFRKSSSPVPVQAAGLDCTPNPDLHPFPVRSPRKMGKTVRDRRVTIRSNVVAAVKNTLCSISMMHIDIQYCWAHPFANKYSAALPNCSKNKIHLPDQHRRDARGRDKA